MSEPGPPSLNATLTPTFVKTLRGVWSMTWRSLVDWKRAPRAAWLLILPAFLFLTTRNASAEGFFEWLQFYLLFVTPLSCAVFCGSMMRGEVQADTMSFLLTRPQTRARLLTAKYLSGVGVLQIALFFETLLVMGVGVWREVPGVGALIAPILAAQFLTVFAWSGLGTLFGLLTPKHVLALIIYGAVVEFGIGNIETNINNLSLIRHLKTVLARQDVIADQFLWNPDGAWKSVLILAAAPAALVFLSAVLFTVREYLHSAEIQK